MNNLDEICEEKKKKYDIDKAEIKGYGLEIGDIFSISAETFFTNSILWLSSFQIQDIYIQQLPRKLFKKWELPFFKRKVTMVKIMYVGGNEC